MMLDVIYHGMPIEVSPCRVIGLALQCYHQSSPILVLEYMAIDKQAFWQAWKAAGGMRQGIMVGGVPFEPPDYETPQDAPESLRTLPAETFPDYTI